MSNIDEDIPLNSKFEFNYKNAAYSIIASFLPTKFGARIAIEINPPLVELSDDFKNKLSDIVQTPSMIEFENPNSDFTYSVAKYLGENYRVLMVENCVKYNLDNAAQIETGKNTGIHFDEILKQIEFQKFEIVFFEKIYTTEQFEKLKLLSKEQTIFTVDVGDNFGEFDFIINSDGKIS